MPNLYPGADPLTGWDELTAILDGALQLPIRLVRDGRSLRWSTPNRHDAEQTARSAPNGASDPTLDAAVISALLSGHRVGLSASPVVVRPGPAFVPDAPLTVGASRPLPTDGSSNRVSLVTLDGVDYVHKRYRECQPGRASESEALRALDGSRTAPALLADYAYYDPDGARWPLGLLYRYVPGAGLDVPLRADLRCRLAASELGPTPLGRTAGRLLRASGALARSVHQLLAVAATDPGGSNHPTVATEFDVTAVLAQAATDLAAVLRRLDALPAWARPVVPASQVSLRAELSAISASAVGHAAAGPCHGDLHLGQVVVGDPDDPGSLRLIDLSPLSLRATDAEFRRQTPWQDLVSMQRALEYFTTQEAHRQVSVVTGLGEDEVSTAAGIGAPLSGSGPSELRRAENRVARWRTAAMAAVLQGYGGPMVSTSDPLYRLLYLVRLLHEFRYDLDHGRHGFVVQNLRRARALPVATGRSVATRLPVPTPDRSR